MESIEKFISPDNRDLFRELTPEVIGRALDPILSSIKNYKPVEAITAEEILETVEFKNISNHVDPAYQLKTTFLGQVGERSVRDIIAKRYEVEFVGKSARNTDLSVVWEHLGQRLKMLIEVKNYTHTVPGSEVDKFYRDLDAHTEACGAVMISINTPIASKYAPAIQYTRRISGGESKPVLFLHGWDIIQKFLNTALEIGFVNATVKNTCNLTEADLTPCINRISDAMAGFSQARTTILEAQTSMNKYFANINSEILGAEHAIREQIRIMWSKIEMENLETVSSDVSTLDIMSKYNTFLNDDTRTALTTVLESLFVDGKGRATLSESSCEIRGDRPIFLRFYKTGKIRCRATFTIDQKDSLPPTNFISMFSLKNDQITMDVCPMTMGYICRKT